jgi:hypothetical protein
LLVHEGVVSRAGTFRAAEPGGTPPRAVETNMLFKRVVAMLARAAGFLGVVGCLAGVYPVWLVGSRLGEVQLYQILPGAAISNPAGLKKELESANSQAASSSSVGQMAARRSS